MRTATTALIFTLTLVAPFEATFCGEAGSARTAQPSPPKAPANDQALAAMVAQVKLSLGAKPKTVELPSDRALEAITAIKRGDFATAARTADNILAHSTLRSWRFYPFNEFMGSVTRGGYDPALLERLNAWVEEEPGSSIAYLIRAKYLESAAWVARGDDVARNTPKSQLKLFADDLDLAAADTKKSISLNPHNPWSYFLLLEVISGHANSKEMEGAFLEGIKAYPTYYELYRARLWSLTPKWGGSVGEMYDFVAKYAATEPDSSPLKLLYLHLYAYLFDAGHFECQSRWGNDRTACINASMDRMTTRTLEQEVQKALGLYKVSNPTEFSRAVWPVLGMMAVSSAGASPRFDAVLQMAATTMDSDNKIIDEPGHNSYVLDDITARVWGAIGNAPNAERKYLEALADAQATSFTDEAERDTALAWIYDDLTRFADDHNQYINIIAYQDASNLVGGTNHSDYPYETCYAYDGLKHYSEAVTECTRLIEGNGNYIQTHYWRAKAYENLDELDEALADYGPIADKGNSWFGVGAAIAMSVIYGKKNDFAGQLASMNKHSYVFDPATQTSDDLAVAYNNRCFAYMKLGRMQKAMDDCTTSLKYGHIPDAVQKQQELIRLGVKSTPIGPDLVARVRTVSPAMVTLAFAAMVLLVRLALPWRRKPSVEISDDLAASRDSLSRYQEMVVISSGMTRFYKFAFPTFWFMFIAVTLVIGLTTGAGRKAPAFFVGPCFMAVFGFFAFKRLIWVLVDEVKDGGTFLIVRNRGKEITVPLSEIMNVSTSTNTNPPRVTLRLSQPGDFGAEIVFVPATKGFSINPFKKNTMVEDLILRVDQARRSSAR